MKIKFKNIFPNLFLLEVYFFLLILGLLQPIHFDEGVFLSIAREMNEGKRLYIDLFDHKNPGIYWLLAFALKITQNLHLLRLIVVAVNSLTVIVLARMLNRMIQRPIVLMMSLLLWVLIYAYNGFFVLTEPFVMIFITLALDLMQNGKKNLGMKSVLIAGVWIGMAFVFKQTALVLVVAMIFYLIFYKRYRQASLFLLGFGTTSLIAILALGMNGQLLPWWESAILFPLTSYPSSGMLEHWKEFIWIALPSIPLMMVVITHAFYLLKKFHLSLILLMSLVPSLMFRPYHQYWLLALPYLILLTSMAMSKTPRYSFIFRIETLVVGLVLVSYYSFVGLGSTRRQLEVLKASLCSKKVPQSYWINDCHITTKNFFEVPSP